jgi:CBS-domain-containing membrane protein
MQDKTKVVSQKEHEEEVVKMIADFLQRMKCMYGMKVRQDIDGQVVVYNSDTGFMKALTELQDKDLI